jgi:hypothetical protein
VNILNQIRAFVPAAGRDIARAQAFDTLHAN